MNKEYGHTTASKCAKEIKKELTKAFPTTEFKVRSQNFSGGDSVNIDYVDGPRQSEVEKITKDYQDGYFDGMQDMYIDSNHNDNKPRAKYVFAHREISEKYDELLKKIVCERFGKEIKDFEVTYEPDLRREYYILECGTDLVNDFKIEDERLKEFYSEIALKVISQGVKE